MAFTFTKSGDTVFGNKRVVMGTVTADSVSGVVSFGLGSLAGVQVTPKSMTTNNSLVTTRYRLNQTAGGVASVGDLGVSGVVSGDEFYVVVYGPA